MISNDILLSVLVFILITFVNVVYAVRIIVLTRGRRLLSTALGFIESITFITSFGRVANDISQWHMVLAYCLGTALGGFLGMIIEARFVTGYVRVNIVALLRGEELCHALRERGYGATMMEGEGRSGIVTLIETVADRRDSDDLIEFIRQQNPAAFITMEESRSVQHGWIRASRRLKGIH